MIYFIALHMSFILIMITKLQLILVMTNERLSHYYKRMWCFQAALKLTQLNKQSANLPFIQTPNKWAKASKQGILLLCEYIELSKDCRITSLEDKKPGLDNRILFSFDPQKFKASGPLFQERLRLVFCYSGWSILSPLCHQPWSKISIVSNYCYQCWYTHMQIDKKEIEITK